MWAYDFVFDRTHNGRALKLLTVIDEYSRECLAIEVARRQTSQEVIRILARLMLNHGVPQYIRSDNTRGAGEDPRGSSPLPDR